MYDLLWGFSRKKYTKFEFVETVKTYAKTGLKTVPVRH